MILLQARRLLRHLSTPAAPDAYLTLLNPRWGSRLRGVIESVTPMTAEAATVRIRPGLDWSGHRAGQFVTLGVDVDGVRHHRCYSLTSPTSATGTIEITVQATADGVVSNHLVHRSRPGEIVQLTQADGDFVLPARTEHLLFVTGGSGITPVMSMLRTLARDADRDADRATVGAPGRDVVVLHHATDPGRCLFRIELAELAERSPWLRVVTVYTRAGGTRLDAARLEELCPDWVGREAFACGPTDLLEFATTHWSDRGALERLRLERFAPAARPSTAAEHDPASHSIARFERAGVDVLANETTPLLDIAEDAGLAPPSGCRVGICHTCTTRLDEGCVRDLRDGRVSEAGQHVQLCVTAAVSDVVLDL